MDKACSLNPGNEFRFWTCHLASIQFWSPDYSPVEMISLSHWFLVRNNQAMCVPTYPLLSVGQNLTTWNVFSSSTVVLLAFSLWVPGTFIEKNYFLSPITYVSWLFYPLFSHLPRNWMKHILSFLLSQKFIKKRDTKKIYIREEI